MDDDEIAIVGAGQAGAAVAARLRSQGYAGRVVILGAETAPPYQRPPLSKKYLSGEWEAERLWLRSAEFWRDNEIELRLGSEVTMIDPELGYLIWNGELYNWTKLVLTTGTKPRPLPLGFSSRNNVYELRNIQDVDRLRPVFQAGKKLVVVGGGYIGLETAAVAASMGLAVTVIEKGSRILERVACAETANAIRDLHLRHDVTILEGRSISAVNGADTIVSLQLDNGTQVACDFVLVGVGVLPQTKLAEEAGIQCDNGILVDAFGRTSATDVWSAGDCACFELQGRLTRLESVQNAIDQAEAVADDMMGRGKAYEPVPWFWSDQYDTKLQIVGLNHGYDTVVERLSARGRSIWYFGDGRLLAVDALNDGRTYMAAKRLLEAGLSVGPQEVRQPDFDPVQLLKK